ncbi:MAG: TetR/AcrR family transcriptional regulator [Phaeodactylibacter sp.]|nr:TetR/AcrR family transcriptional regulator [Phaeodactylibacter sp.]MCB9051656.1 TetR/AcrR family transcriptional regulator [Lewinellaceae bacterium]
MSQDTKEKILRAAEAVFHENGLRGARTTLIAEKAGISRTMLHYYYRTKTALFQEVAQNSLGHFIRHAQQLFENGHGLRVLIEQMVDILCDVLEEKPGIPSFIVNILNESPEMLTGLAFVKEEGIPALFDQLLEEARKEKEITAEISGEGLLLNIYGLCAIPYLTAPLIQFKTGRTNAEMIGFLKERRTMIKAFVWNGIRGNQN